MMLRKVNDRKLIIGLSIILLVLGLINVTKLYGPIIVPDEAGYWAAGEF